MLATTLIGAQEETIRRIEAADALPDNRYGRRQRGQRAALRDLRTWLVAKGWNEASISVIVRDTLDIVTLNRAAAQAEQEATCQ